ncbi:MAG TPA: PEP-CTERM sorting domain-containing protein [Nitrospirae bacterium]|nr:PEP-CTERM motif protein [bacterium BMS3Abin06]HDH12770.1 PEP-CTERM sorting domain-containing protein [Nitrospirota bacterium]HDZ03328.1 PEP-CTERM sorting domain-containing protein [Nitrospirota bacterium]
MKKAGLVLLIAALGMFLLAGSAFALTLDVGSPLLMIDGLGDGGTTVTLGNLNLTGGYGLGYYLNNGSTFIDLGTGFISTTLSLSLNGGDVVDLGLYDDTDSNGGYNAGDTLYTLSGDYSDDSYGLIMGFSGAIDVSNAELPSKAELINMGIDTYWQDVNINWSVAPGFTLTASVQLLSDDGIAPVAPVPEPGTLVLLGSGLVGIAFYARRRQA